MSVDFRFLKKLNSCELFCELILYYTVKPTASVFHKHRNLASKQLKLLKFEKNVYYFFFPLALTTPMLLLAA